MELNQFNRLPAWKDLRLRTDKTDAWKWKEELELGEQLYNQWREVYQLVEAFAESLPAAEDDPLSTRVLIYQNAGIIAPKIISASGNTLYQIKMENAALIRFNCRQLWEQVAYAVLTGDADPEHKQVIESELDRFKTCFRKWVGTFRKDDCPDEWGLF